MKSFSFANSSTNYADGFYLEGAFGNNALDWNERRAAGSSMKLWVPPMRKADLSTLRIGEQIVFEALDENGDINFCKGLEFFARSETRGVETIVVDNHNHVFFFWYEALFSGRISRGIDLLHVDQHKDTRVPEISFKEACPSASLEEVFFYTNNCLNVGNYIKPALESSLIGEFICLQSQTDLLKIKQERPFVLNLDLDFFAPETGVNFETCLPVLQNLCSKAALVTVATSPFFIDQNLALELLRRIYALST